METVSQPDQRSLLMPHRHSNQRNPNAQDFLLLHAVVIIWGLTAVLGKLIDLSAMVLVAWRTGLAAIGMAVWIAARRQSLWPGLRAVLRIMLVGCMIGFHWFLFFLAAKLGPVSVALIGVATCSLWCALLEPLFIRGKRIGGVELSLALVVVLGAAVIGFGDPVSWPCLLTGVAAAAVAALFSYINNALVKDHNQSVITLYEMIGACLFMTALSFTQPTTRSMPQGTEWIWLLVLSQICTVWAFSVYIGLLRRISVYVISLVSNLEPVWGILLAGVIFGEYQKLNAWFWIGGIIVLAGIASYPAACKWRNRRLPLLSESPSP